MCRSLRCFIIVLVSFIFCSAYAQNTNCDNILEGRVLDEHDGSSLSFAEVFIPELNRGVVCGADGGFRMDDLRADTLLLRVTHLGCEPVEQWVIVPSKKPVLIYLEHHHEELKRIEVEAERPDENVGRSVERIDARQEALKGYVSAGQLLSRASGVALNSNGPNVAKPVLHGYSGDRLIIVDRGIRQEEQQWGADHGVNMDPLMSSDIRVIKGAASVEYGSGALGGVIVVDAPNIHGADSLMGNVLLGLNSNGLGGLINTVVHAPVGRFSHWRIQAKGEVYGDKSAPNYVLSNTASRNAGLSFEYGRKKGLKEWHLSYRGDQKEIGVLRAAHIGNLTDLNQSIASGEPQYEVPFTYAIDAPRQAVIHHTISARAVIPTKESNRFVLTYGLQQNSRQEYDRRRGGRSARPSLDLSLTTQTAKIEHKHHLTENIHGKVGADGIYQINKNIQGTGVNPLIPYYELRGAGLFAIEHLDLGSMELEAGARYDIRNLFVARYDANDVLRTPEHDFVNTAFSLGLLKDWGGNKKLRINVSSAFRAPNVSELYSQGLHHASASIEEGNSQLNGERSIKAIAGISKDSDKEKLSWGLTVYADRVLDYILLQPTGTRLTIQGAFPLFEYSNTNAFLIGSDLELAYRFSERTKAKSSALFIKGNDLLAEDHLFGMPPFRLSLALDHIFGDRETGLKLWTRINYVSRQNAVPAGGDIMDPPAAYTLVDLGLNKELGRLSAGFYCNNLFNVSYRDYLDRFRYFADAPGKNVGINLNYKL